MINPRAYLTSVKNVRRGLEARSKILEALAGRELSARELSRLTGLPIHRVHYHLKRLKTDGIVTKRGKGRKIVFRVTGAGQTSLEESLA